MTLSDLEWSFHGSSVPSVWEGVLMLMHCAHCPVVPTISAVAELHVSLSFGSVTSSSGAQ